MSTFLLPIIYLVILITTKNSSPLALDSMKRKKKQYIYEDYNFVFLLIVNRLPSFKWNGKINWSLTCNLTVCIDSDPMISIPHCFLIILTKKGNHTNWMLWKALKNVKPHNIKFSSQQIQGNNKYQKNITSSKPVNTGLKFTCNHNKMINKTPWATRSA